MAKKKEISVEEKLRALFDLQIIDSRIDEIIEKGREIRYGAPYFEEGSNVNFVEKVNDNTFAIRTYERGVEDETLSCGSFDNIVIFHEWMI